jgi:hypothetical protein
MVYIWEATAVWIEAFFLADLSPYVLLFIVANDAMIAGLFWAIRRVLRKSAAMTRLIPDLTPRQEKALAWYIPRQIDGIVELYENPVGGSR